MSKCAICGKEVADADQAEHLETNHLGPYDWWCNDKKYRTPEPSMSGAKVMAIAGVDTGYHFVEERDGKRIEHSWSEAIDLTREPHFYTFPPSTY